MKKFLGVAAFAGSILAAGCGHNAGTDDNGTPAPLPQTNATMNPASPDQTTTTTTETTTTQPATPTPTVTPPTPPPNPATNYPIGILIPRKKGFVQIPYPENPEPVHG